MVGPVPSYLVEVYIATHDAAELESAARQATALAAGSTAIRHLGSVVLLPEEVCLHVFEAPSLATLSAASERARLGHDRVVETVWIPAEDL